MWDIQETVHRTMYHAPAQPPEGLTLLAMLQLVDGEPAMERRYSVHELAGFRCSRMPPTPPVIAKPNLWSGANEDTGVVATEDDGGHRLGCVDAVHVLVSNLPVELSGASARAEP